MNGWVIGILVYVGICVVIIAAILIHLKRCDKKNGRRYIRFADEPEDFRRATNGF